MTHYPKTDPHKVERPPFYKKKKTPNISKKTRAIQLTLKKYEKQISTTSKTWLSYVSKFEPYLQE